VKDEIIFYPDEERVQNSFRSLHNIDSDFKSEFFHKIYYN